MENREPFEWINEESIIFLRRGYLSEGEQPLDRIRTVAEHAEKILGMEGFAEKFYDYMGRGWYSLSSPVWANFGKKRGLPVSCFGSNVGDNIESILYTQAEVGGRYPIVKLARMFNTTPKAILAAYNEGGDMFRPYEYWTELEGDVIVKYDDSEAA